MYVCVYVYMDAFMHACTHARSYARTLAGRHARTHACTHAHTHTHTHTHTCARAHACMHACMHKLLPNHVRDITVAPTHVFFNYSHLAIWWVCHSISAYYSIQSPRQLLFSPPQPTALVTRDDPSQLNPLAPYRLHDAKMPNYEAYRSY